MANPNAKFRDVLRKNVRDSAHRVLKRLGGEGRKRKRATSAKGGKQPSRGKKRKKKIIKRDIFS